MPKSHRAARAGRADTHYPDFVDPSGAEFADMEAVKDEAVRCSADMLKGGHAGHLWSGEPSVLWVWTSRKAAGIRFSR